MNAHPDPRHQNQTEGINGGVKKGNMKWFDKRRDIKWRNNEAKEI